MTGVNRPLSDGEHRLMYDLATGVVAEQTGSDIATAKEALGNFAAKGELNLRGDATAACVRAVSGADRRRFDAVVASWRPSFLGPDSWRASVVCAIFLPTLITDSIVSVTTDRDCGLQFWR
jgi:hypothetical protein